MCETVVCVCMLIEQHDHVAVIEDGGCAPRFTQALLYNACGSGDTLALASVSLHNADSIEMSA